MKLLLQIPTANVASGRRAVVDLCNQGERGSAHFRHWRRAAGPSRSVDSDRPHFGPDFDPHALNAVFYCRGRESPMLSSPGMASMALPRPSGRRPVRNWRATFMRPPRSGRRRRLPCLGSRPCHAHARLSDIEETAVDSSRKAMCSGSASTMRASRSMMACGKVSHGALGSSRAILEATARSYCVRSRAAITLGRSR